MISTKFQSGNNRGESENHNVKSEIAEDRLPSLQISDSATSTAVLVFQEKKNCNCLILGPYSLVMHVLCLRMV